jgi:hypothetical protein
MTVSKATTLINKEIALIAAAGTALDARIHTCAVDVAEHFAEYKDVELVNRLYNALSKGARKSAMTEWLLAYTAVIANTEQATKKEAPFVCAKDAAGNWTKETDVAGGEAHPWYDCKPDPKPDAVFDFQKMVRAALKKYGAAEEVKHCDKAAMEKIAVLAGLSAADVPSRPLKAAPVKDEGALAKFFTVE